MAASPSASSGSGAEWSIEPVSAAVLHSRETKRRDELLRRGPVRTGCDEVDEYILLGGFERGSVVGISAEDEVFGMRVKAGTPLLSFSFLFPFFLSVCIIPTLVTFVISCVLFILLHLLCWGLFTSSLPPPLDDQCV